VFLCYLSASYSKIHRGDHFGESESAHSGVIIVDRLQYLSHKEAYRPSIGQSLLDVGPIALSYTPHIYFISNYHHTAQLRDTEK